MKKVIVLVFCAVLAFVFTVGCVSINFSQWGGAGVAGRGSMEKFTFNVNEITEVRVEMLCNIVYHSAPSDTVTLEVQPNLMEYISVEESGGILTVRSTRTLNITGTGNTPVLTVSTPSLNCVFHAGAGRFNAVDPIVSDDFSIHIAGAADAKAVLDVQNLSVNLAGAGSMELSGTADRADISMAGAGRLNALELQTRSASINLAGVGSVSISCSDDLSVIAGGVGTVEYRGSPTLDLTRGGLVTVRQVD
ncbi:MAG: DUF2807 domain-containing protein [Oscillospiraceae bacterium]|nr:DUF2807 domain-containing protein [Oscillospiraceae bacterium]